MAHVTKISGILTALFLLGITAAIAGESTNIIFQRASSIHQDIAEYPGRLLSLNHQNTISTSTGKKPDSPNDSPARIKTDIIDSNELLAPLRTGKVFRKNQKESGGNARGPSLSLSLFEEKYRLAPDARLALTDLEVSRSRLEQKQAQSGLKLFAGVGVGAYKTPVTDSLIRDFQRGNVRVGLRYPLLGSLAQEEIGIIKAETRARKKEQEIELIHHNNLGALRGHYIDYWASQKKMVLGEAFLKNEQQVKRTLGRRTRAGYLLDADRQKFLSSFALVRRNLARSKSLLTRSLNILKILTNQKLTAFVPAPPQLPEPCLDPVRLRKTVLEKNPELNLIRIQADAQQSLQRAMSHSDIKADVSLAGTASSDLPESQVGYGVTLKFNVQLPASINKLKTARRNIAQATYKKTRQQLSLKREVLAGESEDAIYRYLAARETIQFATSDLKAERESVRENRLRSTHLQGDTIEKLQQSRYRYYQSALRYIDAEADKLKVQIQLLQYAPNGCIVD